MSTITTAARAALLSAAAVASFTNAASAVVVFGADSGARMDAPQLGFVGSWNGSSAVAVGDRWIITAAHVGGRAKGTFDLAGERYRGVERVVNVGADLALIRLDRDLPGWHTITSDVSRRDEVLLAGAGRVAGDLVRAETYAWSRERELTWGENVIDRISRGRIEMTFDAGRRGALEFEAGFALNDSGGGVFVVSDEGELLLAGIARGVSELNVTRRGSRSYATLLADHLGWINSILGEQQNFFALWLDSQDQAGEFVDAIAQAPAPGAGFAILGFCGIFASRRRR